MVATLASIYRSEGSLFIQGYCTRYCGSLARARWGQNNGSVAQPTEYFRGRARLGAIGTFPGEHWEVRCRARALLSPYRDFCLAKIPIRKWMSRRTIIVCFVSFLHMHTPYHRRFLPSTDLIPFFFTWFSYFRDFSYPILLRLTMINLVTVCCCSNSNFR